MTPPEWNLKCDLQGHCTRSHAKQPTITWYKCTCTCCHATYKKNEGMAYLSNMANDAACLLSAGCKQLRKWRKSHYSGRKCCLTCRNTIVGFMVELGWLNEEEERRNYEGFDLCSGKLGVTTMQLQGYYTCTLIVIIITQESVWNWEVKLPYIVHNLHKISVTYMYYNNIM